MVSFGIIYLNFERNVLPNLKVLKLIKVAVEQSVSYGDFL